MSRAGILRGEAAALSSCRVRLLPAVDDSAAALEQILAEQDLLYGPVAVTALFPASGDPHVDENDNNHRVPGTLVVASKHLLFWADTSSTAVGAAASDYDLRVDAFSIDLHALTGVDNINNTQEEEGDNDDGDEEERESGGAPPSAVYIQMSSEDHHEDGDDENGNDSSLFELTVQPTASQQGDDDNNTENGGQTDKAVERISRQLFEAISKMISLNPIDPNDQDEPPENDGGALFGEGGGPWITGEGFSNDGMMGSGMTPAQLMEWETHNNDDDDDDDLVFAAAASDAPPTEDERNAMLERLDNLLIVPPEFEVHDDDGDASTGQFDDADEDDDDDADLL